MFLFRRKNKLGGKKSAAFYKRAMFMTSILRFANAALWPKVSWRVTYSIIRYYMESWHMIQNGIVLYSPICSSFKQLYVVLIHLYNIVIYYIEWYHMIQTRHLSYKMPWYDMIQNCSFIAILYWMMLFCVVVNDVYDFFWIVELRDHHSIIFNNTGMLRITFISKINRQRNIWPYSLDFTLKGVRWN